MKSDKIQFCPAYRPQSVIVLLYLSLINRCHTGINKNLNLTDMQCGLNMFQICI
jgi:hypothetical protein